MSKIIPLGKMVLLEPIAAEEKTKSGLIIPESSQEKPLTGKVIARGANVTTVKEEQIALYDKYKVRNIAFQDKQYLLVNEDDILAVIE